VGRDEGRPERLAARRPIRSYRDLLAWQKAMDLLELVYRLTLRLPSREAFGLAGQLRRAVVSVPGNIAEGHGRLHRGDFVRHLAIARGSLLEVETYLLALVWIGYVPEVDAEPALATCDEVSRLIAGLLKSLGELRFHGPRR